jgi:hypothetical protein
MQPEKKSFAVMHGIPDADPDIHQPQAAQRATEKPVLRDVFQLRKGRKQAVLAPDRSPGKDYQKHTEFDEENHLDSDLQTADPEVEAAFFRLGRFGIEGRLQQFQQQRLSEVVDGAKPHFITEDCIPRDPRTSALHAFAILA